MEEESIERFVCSMEECYFIWSGSSVTCSCHANIIPPEEMNPRSYHNAAKEKPDAVLIK